MDAAWIKAALKRRGTTQAKLAERLGVDPSAVTLMLQGRRNVQAREAAIIADFIGEPLQEVMRRVGADRLRAGPPATLRLAGYVAEGAEVRPYRREIDAVVERCEIPAFLSADGLEGVRVAGGGLPPLNGWVLFYRRPAQDDPPVAPDCIDQLCIVQLRDGPRLVRHVQKGSRDGLYNLWISPYPPEYDVRLDWAAKVLGAVPSG